MSMAHATRKINLIVEYALFTQGFCFPHSLGKRVQYVSLDSKLQVDIKPYPKTIKPYPKTITPKASFNDHSKHTIPLETVY